MAYTKNQDYQYGIKAAMTNETDIINIITARPAKLTSLFSSVTSK